MGLEAVGVSGCQMPPSVVDRKVKGRAGFAKLEMEVSLSILSWTKNEISMVRKFTGDWDGPARSNPWRRRQPETPRPELLQNQISNIYAFVEKVVPVNQLAAPTVTSPDQSPERSSDRLQPCRPEPTY